jgi:tocopherol cyclase
MAHGLATGWAEWGDRRYEFQRAPTYAEKNWGGAFPDQWFWMQANAFQQTPDLSVVAVGSLREALGRTETVGLIGLHFQGRFIVLSSLNQRVAWQVSPWGSWQIEAWNHRYRVRLQGQTDRDPSLARIPTLEGLQFGCWDTTHGDLVVQVWERSLTPPYSEALILQDSTALAALEIGRQGCWQQPWQFAN